MSQPDYKARVTEINRALEQTSVSFKEVATKGFNLEQAYRIYYTAITRTPKLLLCTTESLCRCLVDAASLGLYIGSTLGQCYPVPFKNSNLKPPLTHEAVFMLGYQGMTELVRRSGEVESITAEIVYENDEFEHRKGLNPVLNHIPYGYDSSKWGEVAGGNLDRGRPVFGYCVTVFKGGGHHVETMTFDQIEARRARSRAKNDGPWKTDWAPMARKTMVRASFPYLPKTPELLRALALDDRVELPEAAGPAIPVGAGAEVPLEPESEIDKLTGEIIAKTGTKPEPEPTQRPPAKRSTTKRKKSTPSPAEPENVAQEPSTEASVLPDHLAPEDPVEEPESPPVVDPADLEVSVDRARQFIHDSLSTMERGHQNVLSNQFKKARGVDWKECEDPTMLEAFYQEIEDAKEAIASH